MAGPPVGRPPPAVGRDSMADYACRRSVRGGNGRGFDSRRLHERPAREPFGLGRRALSCALRGAVLPPLRRASPRPWLRPRFVAAAVAANASTLLRGFARLWR